MNFLSNRIVARLLWALPLLLLIISALLVQAGLEQHTLAERGDRVEAEILEVFVRERSEITRGDVRLRYTPPGAEAPIERRVELPLVFLKELEGQEGSTLPIAVVPGSDQVLLETHPRAQWIMTFAFAAMSLLGAVGLGGLVGGWNRFLAREGDPAERTVEAEAHRTLT